MLFVYVGFKSHLDHTCVIGIVAIEAGGEICSPPVA